MTTHVPATPANFFKTEGLRAVWWPEHLAALRAALGANPEDAVKLVVDYRTRGKDEDRPVGAIYTRLMAVKRSEGLLIAATLTRQLHGLMKHERELRTAPPEAGARQAPSEAPTEAPPAHHASDVALRALVKTWRAGALTDGELLAALRGLGA